jgi:hypothetical protein
MRKTFSVDDFTNWANGVLAMPESDVITPEHKQGVIHALDQVLHAAGRYNGFRYLDTYDSEDPEFYFNGRKSVRRLYFTKVL